MSLHRALPFFIAFLCALSVAPGATKSLLAPEPVPLDSLAGFRPMAGGNWTIAGGVGGDPRREKALVGLPGVGTLVCAPTKTARDNLVTAWEHGDIELELEFMMAPGSNSGVYLQGRYEVQLFDSWGVKEPKQSDCGGIYERWDTRRPEGQRGYDGRAPLANACRAPGLWQRLRVEFEAPRFDAQGRKTANARFVSVELNGFVIHENVEATGPTRSGLAEDEKPLGPLMIQGDHAPVAIRAISVKRREPGARVAVSDLEYKLYLGDYLKTGDYDGQTPSSQGRLDRLSQAAVNKGGRFGLVITGRMSVPRAGDFAFTTEAMGSVRLIVGDQVAIIPYERSSMAVKVSLAAGTHPFRLDYHTGGGGRFGMKIMAEGPGFAATQITDPDSYPVRPSGSSPAALRIEPIGDRVRLQRSFVPFDPKKRLYAVNVGSPAGAHYAYDFETGAILRAWRGHWLDTTEMWEDRGAYQVAAATGPALTLNALPAIALIENPAQQGWPEAPDALWSSQGYVLEGNGQPVFLSTLSGMKIRDRIASAPDGRGLIRTLEFSGRRTDWQTCVLLAQAPRITAQPGGRGWIIGDREWYLDWPEKSAHMPVVQTRGGVDQLVVRLSDATLAAPLNYSIVW